MRIKRVAHTQNSVRHRQASRLAAALLLGVSMHMGVAFADDYDGAEMSDYSLRLSQDVVLQKLAKAQLRLATAALLPKIGVASEWVVDGKIKYSPDITVLSPDSYNKKDPSAVGIEATWRIFDGFKNINDIRAAREAMSSAAQQSLDVKQKLLLERADRLLEVVRNRKVVATYAEAVRRRQQAYNIARELLADKAMTVSDVALSASDLEGARADRKQAESLLSVSELDYIKFDGRPAPSSITLKVPSYKFPDSERRAMEVARANSPLPRMAFHREKEAEYKVNSAKGMFLPTVDLVGRYQRTYDPSPTVKHLDNYAALFRVRIPLLDASLVPNLEVARVEAAQRRYDRQDTILAVGMEARKQYKLYYALSSQLETLEKQMRQAKRAADAIRIEMEIGQRTIIELLDAEAKYLSARVTLAQSRYERDVAGFRLLATIGNIEERDFAGQSGLY